MDASSLLKKRLEFVVVIIIATMIFAPILPAKELKNELVTPQNNVFHQSIYCFYDRDVLYVGGSGPRNYSKIQNAIDDAEDGDTIYVYKGTYEENLFINKEINLIGENKHITIIAGRGLNNVIELNSNYTTIQGFTLKNKIGANDYYGILMQGHNNLFQGNIIQNSSYGIGIIGENSCINTIEENSIKFSTMGIQINQGKDNTISKNYVQKNLDGLCIQNLACNNIIVNNSFQNNRYGIRSVESGFNTVTHNEMKYNEMGLFFIASFWNSISKNNFIKNSYHASFIRMPIVDLFMRKDLWDIARTMDYPHKGILFSNRWNQNYWDDWDMRLPRPIEGYSSSFIFPEGFRIFWFDWQPAQEPYEIIVTL